MIPRGQEMHPAALDSINQAMLLRNTPGPGVGQAAAQGFGLPRSLEGIAQDCLGELQDSQRSATVDAGPVLEVLAKLRLHHGQPLTRSGQSSASPSRSRTSSTVNASPPPSSELR